MTRKTAIVLLGIAAEFALVMFIIFMMTCAYDYFVAPHQVLALAFGRVE